MNRSKRRAFERMAAKHPDRIYADDVISSPPGMATLIAVRRARGWTQSTTLQAWEPRGWAPMRETLIEWDVIKRIENQRMAAAMGLPAHLVNPHQIVTVNR